MAFVECASWVESLRTYATLTGVANSLSRSFADRALVVNARDRQGLRAEQFADRLVIVAKAVGVDSFAAADQGFDVIEHVPDIDRHRGQDPVSSSSQKAMNSRPETSPRNTTRR